MRSSEPTNPGLIQRANQLWRIQDQGGNPTFFEQNFGSLHTHAQLGFSVSIAGSS